MFLQLCGLKWSPDDRELASGGNDNQLNIWNSSSTVPVIRFQEHLAAVKAISWSPHQQGLLASGGGTADRCIRFWNTSTGSQINCVDTGCSHPTPALQAHYSLPSETGSQSYTKIRHHGCWPLTKTLNKASLCWVNLKCHTECGLGHRVLTLGGFGCGILIAYVLPYTEYLNCTLMRFECLEGSQVCNLVWSKNVNELVSTHGYSQNQIVVWKYPSMNKITTLVGHNTRVLYLAQSPDGQTVVTGAGKSPLLSTSQKKIVLFAQEYILSFLMSVLVWYSLRAATPAGPGISASFSFP